MPRPGIAGNADSIGLGVRYTGLVKLDSPVPIPKVVEDPCAATLLYQAGLPQTNEAESTAICDGLDGKQLDEILDSIQPPIEWDEKGQHWKQQISREPATRYDIVHLQRQLDFLMKQKHARRDGLCPLRRELYSQCFNELIRQITINSPELGLLLLRVREEILMTFGTYHALHETSIAFGTQEADQFIALKQEPVDQLESLRAEKNELEKTLAALTEDAAHLQESFAHKKEANDKVHLDKMQLFKRTQQMLKQHLEHIVAPVVEEVEKEDSDFEF